MRCCCQRQLLAPVRLLLLLRRLMSLMVPPAAATVHCLVMQVVNFKYPEQLRQLTFSWDYMMKGLIIDKVRAALLMYRYWCWLMHWISINFW